MSSDDRISSKQPSVKEFRPVTWQTLAQSFALVTFTGVGGSIAGIAVQKQQERHESRNFSKTARLQSKQHKAFNSKTHVNHPMRWSLQCMLFAAILEASRLASPTMFALRQLHLNKTLTDQQYVASIALGDCTFGGTVAGVVGSFLRRNIRGWHAGTGIASGSILGFVAGAGLAGLSVLELSVQRDLDERRIARMNGDEDDDEI
jgi:hypothetical protein